MITLSLLALSLLLTSMFAVAAEGTQFSVTQASSIQGETEQYGWQPTFFGAGVNGIIYAMTIYQDRLVFAGDFTFGGADEYNGIALWDGYNLFPLEGADGVGVNGQVNALAVHNDKLIVAGKFTEAGGVSVSNIAQWDGMNWSALNQGTSGPVYALTVFENELVVGGEFAEAGGENAYSIARWDGFTWGPLTGENGSGTSGRVFTLTVYNDELVAGGQFFQAGGIAVHNIARWDGNEWHPLTGPEGTGTSGTVRALQEFNGELVVGGDFSSAGSVSASRIARWNGSQWAGFDACCGVGTSGSVRSLAVFNNDLIVGGSFDWVGGFSVNSIVRWNGTQWHSIDGPAGPGRYDVVHTLENFGNELIIGAGPSSVELPTRISGIIRWNGSEWRQLNGTGETGLFGRVSASALYEGQLVVGGDFETAGTRIVNNIARWNGTSWVTMGAGLEFPVRSLVVFDDQLIAVGTKTIQTYYGVIWKAIVAAWNGAEWVHLPALTGSQNSYAYTTVVFDGKLVVAGEFSHADETLVNNIAAWNGNQWEPLQMGENVGIDGRVHALAIYDGQLIVGGRFDSAGGQATNNIARWDGNYWYTFPGNGVTGFASQVSSLAELENELYIGGRFSSAGAVPVLNVARWDGNDWHALGDGVGHSLDLVDSLTGWNGEVVAGGSFSRTGDLWVNHIARWDGSDWIALDGPNGAGLESGRIFTMLPLGDSLAAGGKFDVAGGVSSWNFGKFILQPSWLEIVDRSPVQSDIGEPVQVTARVHGTATSPIDARGTIYSSSGDSCTTLHFDIENETSSSFTCSLVLSSGGLHSLTAVFSASPTHKSSTSEAVPHMVRMQSETNITGLSPDSSQVAGQPIQIFVEVNGSSDPAGTIHIGDGIETLCTIILPDDNCSFILHEIGPVVFSADYSGDSVHGPSSDSVAYAITESSLAFAPNPLDFEAVGVGHSSEPKSVTITNTSDQSLSIEEFILPTNSAFSQTGGSCDMTPLTLPVGTGCTLEFQFSPTEPGLESIVVEVQSDTPEGTHVFFLQGTGVDTVFHDRFQSKR